MKHPFQIVSALACLLACTTAGAQIEFKPPAGKGRAIVAVSGAGISIAAIPVSRCHSGAGAAGTRNP